MNEKKKRMGSDPFDFIGGSKINEDRGKPSKTGLKTKEKNKKESKTKTYKHTNTQTQGGKISEVGERTTFYIKPDLLTEIKIISIKSEKKNVSELVNEAIEDLIDKYNKNSSK